MILGITGGIGCGKSAVLNVLKDEYGFHILEADKVAHELMQPGQKIYENVVLEFGQEILQEDGGINRQKLGAIVFEKEEQLKKLNRLTHPAVIEELKNRIVNIRKEKGDTNFAIEAALLIESGCYTICDYVWYIYANDEVRKQRLKEYRGYSAEKIESVIKNQLSNETFWNNADCVIDNSGTLENTKEQIQKKLVLT